MNLVNNELLIEKGIIEGVCEYQGLDAEKADIYKYFDDKFRSLFREYSSVFGLKNCVFYIKNYYYCNAFASNNEGYNIMGINIGYPILMKSKFDEKYLSTILAVALINESSVSEAYCDLNEDPNFKFNEFMLDCSIHFTFSHEFRHILQHNTSEIAYGFEYGEILDTTSFDLKKHAREFDADRMASFEVLKYIFGVHRKLESKNADKFKCMVYLGLASIIITKSLFYFGVMNQFPPKFTIDRQDFYTKKFSHPHPLVRIYNILEVFYGDISDDFPDLKIDSQSILNNILGIVKIYLNTLIPDKDVMLYYFEDSKKFLDEINKYNQELYDCAIEDNSIRFLLETHGVAF
jgi:hypothetical protein